MKKGLVVAIFTLLLLPVVAATVTITSPSQSEYNLGETIDISGYIQASSDIDGELAFSLICRSKTYTIPRTSFSLVAGDTVSFSSLNIPTLTATSGMLGVCKLSGKVIVSDVTIDAGTSKSFEITDELDGSFHFDKSQVQLGDTIVLTGTVSTVNGDPIDGTAEVSLSYAGDEYPIGTTTIADGLLSYSYTFLGSSAGTYDVTLTARDNYGNTHEFSTLGSVTVIDDLDVTLSTNEISYLPGDVVNVFGEARTALGDYVESASVTISFNDATVSTALDQSQYTQDLSIPSTIPSGEKTITVEVTDGFGNSGTASTTIDITPLASTITNTVSPFSLNPEEQFTVSVALGDQAGDPMDGTVSVVVKDARNRVVSEKTLAADETITYLVPQFASPGEWTITSMYVNPETLETIVEATDTIIVNEVQKLSWSVVGEKLSITNAGNVPYTEDLAVEVDGVDEEYLIERARSLGVNETVVIDLAEELPTGAYTLSIPTGYSVEEGTVTISKGTPRSPVSWPYAIFVLILTITLAFLIYRRFHGGKTESKQRFSPEKRIRLYDSQKKEEKPKKPSVTFEDPQQNLEDFKKRTLEEIRRTEEKIAKEPRSSSTFGDGKIGYVTGRRDHGYSTRREPVKEEKKPSVFNLFGDE